MKLGVIAGSGMYEFEGIENVTEINVETPFGPPSDTLVTGTFQGTDIVFLPRHGRGHRILPGELNHKANIFALKKLGVTHILSISAVGSLREELAPRDVVIVDQYFDRTKNGLEHTFFGNGIVAHIAFGDPACPVLKEIAYEAAKAAVESAEFSEHTPTVHNGGTYVNMEGPAFSTKAESNFYRSCGFDVIGMTNLPEAKLAREAEMSYVTVAMVTDYDCWHSDHDNVTVEMIIANLVNNTALAKNIVKNAAGMHERFEEESPATSALACALITDWKVVPEETKENLRPIIGKYIPQD